MREEFINQFEHFWRTFESVISDFDDQSWRNLGFGQTQPCELALHILGSTKYYIQDTATPMILKSGKPLPGPGQLKPEELPTPEDAKC